MSGFIIYSQNYRPTRSHYGFGLFLFDLLMLTLTLGFWLIFMWCREMRRNTRKRPYGLGQWIWDCFLTVISLGLWLFRIFFRELGN